MDISRFMNAATYAKNNLIAGTALFDRKYGDDMQPLGGIAFNGTLGGKGVRLLRNLSSSHDHGLLIRQDLLEALNREFSGRIPDSVIRAMKVDKLASGFATREVNGKVEIYATNHPLTARRVNIIMNAVIAERLTRARTVGNKAIDNVVKTLVKHAEGDLGKDSAHSKYTADSLKTIGNRLKDLVGKALERGQTDMKRLLDSLFDQFDSDFEIIGAYLDGKGQEAHELVEELRAKGHSALREVVSSVGMTRFSGLGPADVFGKGPCVFPCDAKMVEYAKKTLDVELNGALGKDKIGNVDKFIDKLIEKYLGDANRGVDVRINGRNLPKPPSGELKSEEKDKLKSDIRKILDDLCRDPKTGEVDKKSLAVLARLIDQRMMYYVPFANGGGALDTKDMLPLSVRANTPVRNREMTTEITTPVDAEGKPVFGTWNVHLKMGGELDKVGLVEDSESTVLLGISDEHPNRCGFEAKIVVTSGLGVPGGNGDPVFELQSDGTFVSFDFNAPARRAEVERLYRERVDQLANGTHKYFDEVLKQFNAGLQRVGGSAMNGGAFRAWVSRNRDALIDRQMKKSDELLENYRSCRDEASSDFFGYPGIDAYDTRMGHDLAWSSSADLFADFWLNNNPPS